jgi:hypothetical protein
MKPSQNSQFRKRPGSGILAKLIAKPSNNAQQRTSGDCIGMSVLCQTTEVGIKNPRTQSITLGVLRAAAHPNGAPYLSGG